MVEGDGDGLWLEQAVAAGARDLFSQFRDALVLARILAKLYDDPHVRFPSPTGALRILVVFDRFGTLYRTGRRALGRAVMPRNITVPATFCRPHPTFSCTHPTTSCR